MHEIPTKSSISVQITDLVINRGGKQIYNKFSMEFEHDKVTALIAPSGAGKTTLLDCIAGSIKPEYGKIEFFDESIGTKLISVHPACLFQEPCLIPWRTIEENILIPLENFYQKKEAILRTEQFLNAVGLIQRRKALPSELSGGEKQRVALARAFAFPSSLLLMDEAFQSQDIKQKILLMELFISLLRSEKKTVVLVTHDVREALCLSDRVILLDGTPLKIKQDEKLTGINDCNLNIQTLYTEPCMQMLEQESRILSLLLNH